MPEVQGKIWGTTSLIFHRNNVEIHRITGIKDGYSSIHRHLFKANQFVVESGSIAIHAWKPYGLVDKTILSAGDTCTVQAGEWHKFVVLEPNTVVYEIYWTELNQHDIERKDHGGIKKSPGSRREISSRSRPTNGTISIPIVASGPVSIKSPRRSRNK